MQEPQSRKRGSTAKRRRGARQKAMQALYQWDFDRLAHSPERIVEQFCAMQNMDKVDVEYFEALFIYAAENASDIDAEISTHLDRTLDQLDPIERSVLRICCTELKTQLGTPYKVVVNEALEISKDFGADKGYRYINGIADKLAGSLRKIEYVRDHPDGNPLSEQEIKEPRARTTPQSNVKISMKEKPETSERDKSKSPSSVYAGSDRKVAGRGSQENSTAGSKRYAERPVPQQTEVKATDVSAGKVDTAEEKSGKTALTEETQSPEEPIEGGVQKNSPEAGIAEASGNVQAEDDSPEEVVPADSPWAKSPLVKKSLPAQHTDDDDQEVGKQESGKEKQ